MLLLILFTYICKIPGIFIFVIHIVLQTKDRDLDFDVDTAIRVCRQVSAEDALLLAKKHGRHDWYFKIQLEDREQYAEVLEYVAQLEFAEVRFLMNYHQLQTISGPPLL